MGNYKEDFNEWAFQFWLEHNEDPSHEACIIFEENYKNNLYDFAENYAS